MYYGCDSASNSFPCGANFYIGQIGYGTTQSYTYFNTAAANAVGAANTYGYWFVYGPDAVDATTDAAAYSWGQQQADAAYAARLNAPAPIGRVTVFADVEGGPGSNGWSSNVALNRKVWEGFFNQLAAHVLSAGLYSTSYQWTQTMGSGYGIPAGTSVWSADSQNTPGCDSCPSSFPELPSIGGVSPVIWQYNGTPGCSADLNAANSLP